MAEIQISDHYRIVVKINSKVSGRPTLEAEVSMVLIRDDTDVLHMSNYHEHDAKLKGYPTRKMPEGRRIYLSVGPSSDLNFNALEDQFVDECCAEIGDSYRDKLKQELERVTLDRNSVKPYPGAGGSIRVEAHVEARNPEPPLSQ